MLYFEVVTITDTYHRIRAKDMLRVGGKNLESVDYVDFNVFGFMNAFEKLL